MILCKKVFLIFLISIFLIVSVQSTGLAATQDDEKLSDIKTTMLNIYKNLTNESCGNISKMLIASLEEKGYKTRFIQWFTDTAQGYTTHTGVEVYYNDKWIYMDPTFNGYYTRDGNILSAYEIREAVKNNYTNIITWNQNGLVKVGYDITKYYINPLYLTKGLMYRIAENDIYRYYVVIDEWTPSISQIEGIFVQYPAITPITHPNMIKNVPSWGIDKGLSDQQIIQWGNYKQIYVENISGSWKIETDSGGLVAKYVIGQSGYYTIEFPIEVLDGKVTVSLQNNNGKYYTFVTTNDDDNFFKSKVFSLPAGEIMIYVYQDTPVKFIINPEKSYVRKVINDFINTVNIINAS